MKNTIVLAAVAGIASAAAAQSGSLTLVPSVTTIDSSVSTSFTMSVYANADFGTHIAGGAFSLANAGGAGIVTDMDFASVGWGEGGENDRGHDADGNYTGVVFGQIIIPAFNLQPSPDSAIDGDVFVGSFMVTIAAGSEGLIDWTTGVDGISPFVLEIYDAGDESSTSLLNGDFDGHGGARVNVVPAPSALALLGLGGIAAGRRRR